MSADDPITPSAALLRQRLGTRTPRVAVLLGSGWGRFAERVADAVDVPYTELPAFPALAVGGHAGLLRAGRLDHAGTAHDVLVLAGRKHTYETGVPDGMAGAIRTLAAVGVRVLVQTNAAGSLDAALPPGSVMLIDDHLNLVQQSPLVGTRGDGRFVDMGAAYDPTLRAVAQAATVAHRGEALANGTYAWVLGPQFETPAEIRMIRGFGARAVGMSTVPETILARHAGLRVLGLSLMTNMAAGLSDETLSHGHTMATAEAASERAVALLEAVVHAVAARVATEA